MGKRGETPSETVALVPTRGRLSYSFRTLYHYTIYNNVCRIEADYTVYILYNIHILYIERVLSTVVYCIDACTATQLVSSKL